MRAQAFTDEEVKILRENKYTSFVSNSSIRFTLEFKEMFMERNSRESLPGAFLRKPVMMWTSLVQTVSKTCQSASQKKRLHQAACMRDTIYTRDTRKMQITAACRRKKQGPPCSARSCTCARSLSL